MNRTNLGLSILTLAIGVLGCTPTHERTADADVDSGVPCVDPGSDPDPKRGAEPALPRSMTVARGTGSAPHEVELDPRGEVALTVDEHGRVQLWPDIRSGDPSKSTPYALPVEEPMWISIAQASKPDLGVGFGVGFVVALIDTANVGRVLSVVPSEDRLSAVVTELFALAPNDPLLEIHALDGGERLLALGVDHRVRLYDRTGKLISVIDQRGFMPWQLRVAYAEGEGEPIPKLAAILSPSKVQRIALIDDQLSLVGEAQQVALDRGPNRNDLLLSPDGKTVATLRRRAESTPAFTIQLIDLETNDRRLIAGETGTTIRSRMHFVDAERILLETGNPSGKGLWLDLGQAVAITDLADADPESKFAKKLASQTKHSSIPLVASAERRPEWFDPSFPIEWDHGDRLHASVAGGVRVNIDRVHGFDGRILTTELIVDPLDSDRHFVLGAGSLANRCLALDWTGRRRAAVSGPTLWIAEVDNPLARTEITHGLGEPKLVAFVDETRIVMVDDRGALALFDTNTGALVASLELEVPQGLEAIEFIPDDEQGGRLGWRGRVRTGPVRLLPIRAGVLGEVTLLADSQRPAWLDVAELGDTALATALGVSAREADEVDEVTSDGAGRWFYTKPFPRTPLVVVSGTERRSLELPAGQARELRLSPDHNFVAIVQFRERDDSSNEDHLVSVLDVATGERLWTIGSPGPIAAPIWSRDGNRIFADGRVRDAKTGEPIGMEPPDLVITDLADADRANKPAE